MLDLRKIPAIKDKMRFHCIFSRFYLVSMVKITIFAVKITTYFCYVCFILRYIFMKTLYLIGMLLCFILMTMEIIVCREIRVLDLIELLLFTVCSWFTLIFGILTEMLEWFDDSNYNKVLYTFTKRNSNK